MQTLIHSVDRKLAVAMQDDTSAAHQPALVGHVLTALASTPAWRPVVPDILLGLDEASLVSSLACDGFTELHQTESC